MKYFIAIVLLVFVYSEMSYTQSLYQGPANGSVPSGVIVNTNNFLGPFDTEPLPPSVRRPVRNKIKFEKYPSGMNKIHPAALEGSNFKKDISTMNSLSNYSEPVVVENFQGFLDPGNYIPPDQYIAAGPTHIIAVDNNRFRIFEKSGKLVKNFDIDTWFAGTASGVSAFDPKVSYDHFSKRWIMVWLHLDNVNSRSFFLLSVSDDSIPTGIWYNWALPSNVNGSAPSNSWGDYQGVGFDDKAIYITANQFAFGGWFSGSRVRIIEKTQLYNNTAGQVVWTDFWDIRDPGNFANRTFGIRPSIHYSTSSDYYLMVTAPYNPGTFMGLFKITNPTTNPVMTAVNIPVTQYSDPPGANQLGGSQTLIESGGDDFRNEPVYYNGNIYCTHQIKSGAGGSYSSVRYLKINTLNNQVLEDGAMGADGYWYYYPAIAVDKDENVAITFSRSGLNEYIGAYYTTRLSTMPAGDLSGSRLIMNGKGNYVKTFSSGRNRWGDYNGIWVDPADRNSIWLISQYAEKNVNTWASQIAMIRMVPFSGNYFSTDLDTVNFGTISVSTVSQRQIKISNLGSDTLSISSISSTDNDFSYLGEINFPIKLGYNQTYILNLKFSPTFLGTIIKKENILLETNSGQKKIPVTGKSYNIFRAADSTLYAVTGQQSSGVILKLNKYSGTGTLIGNSGYSEIRGIVINKSNNIIQGFNSSSTETSMLFINSKEGDVYPANTIPLGDVYGMDYDFDGNLYCAKRDGNLFRHARYSNYDTAIYVGNTGISNLYSIAINPLNGYMYGVSLNNKIYRINKFTAESEFLNNPGFTLTPSIAFDAKGNLYGLSGLGNQNGVLLKYDTTTFLATVVGNTNFKAVNSIAFSGVYSEPKPNPYTYELEQNYPNPFNPKTTIRFSINEKSDIKITVYDIRGRKVKVIVDGTYSAGYYSLEFNSSDISSGVYFYTMETRSVKVTKKMVVLK